MHWNFLFLLFYWTKYLLFEDGHCYLKTFHRRAFRNSQGCINAHTTFHWCIKNPSGIEVFQRIRERPLRVQNIKFVWLHLPFLIQNSLLLLKPLLDVKLNFVTAVKRTSWDKVEFLLCSNLLLSFFITLVSHSVRYHKFTLTHRAEKYSSGRFLSVNFVFPAVSYYSVPKKNNHTANKDGKNYLYDGHLLELFLHFLDLILLAQEFIDFILFEVKLFSFGLFDPKFKIDAASPRCWIFRAIYYPYFIFFTLGCKSVSILPLLNFPHFHIIVIEKICVQNVNCVDICDIAKLVKL